MNPLISIIIPTYNRGHLIGETIDSIIAQSYKNWECIVVDDGSTDFTQELMEFYCAREKRITYHQRPLANFKGPSSCRNFGFKKSRGSWIKWFDSDDILMPDALSLHLDKLQNRDVVISKVKYINEEGNSIKLKHQYLPVENIIEEYFTGRITYYTFAPLWNRNFLEQQPYLFDEEIRNLDDWDFNLRMLYENPRIDYIHHPLVLYRLHENSLSQEINKLNFDELKSEFNARKKHLDILKNYSQINILSLREFDKSRCKSKLKKALRVNHEKKIQLYCMLSVRQLKLFQLKEFLSTTIGLLLYTFFGKGERFLK